MAKATSVWECQQCGSQSPKWSGKCPDCGKWNTLVETVVSTTGKGRGKREEGRGRAGAGSARPQKLSDVLKNIDPKTHRITTAIGELDRVLGGPPSPGASARQGGLVPGQVVLLAGEPGMGKSTLLSQVALALGVRAKGQGPRAKGDTNTDSLSPYPLALSPSILYVCGEESPSQVALRLQRLGGSRLTVNDSRLTLLPETDVDAVIVEIGKQFGYQSSVFGYRSQVNQFSVNRSKTDKLKTEKPETENGKQRTDNGIVIIDSIQTMSTADLSGMAGAVGQIRESAGRLSQVAKQLNIPIFLVGHVTKEGEVAGPKVLEHMVDTVLVMEGDRSGSLRILRSLKNRFGPVDEVGIFSMDDGGMREVKNPAELLVGDLAGRAPGSVLGCVLEGQRPLVLEIQALAVPTKLSFPRRVGQGIGERRLQLLCAVIEKHLGLGIGEKDVFVNVAGGLKSSDPGLDLPVVAAIVSSARKKIEKEVAKLEWIGKVKESRDISPSRSLSNPASHPPSSIPIFCGEVGLLGEVRMVPGWPRREKEVGRLGLGKLVGKTEIGHISQLGKFLQ